MYTIQESIIYEKEIKKYLAGGVHHNFKDNNTRSNICFVKGDKSRLWDIDGNEYLDLYAKSGAMMFGHNHKYYNESLKKSIDGLTQVDLTPLDIIACEYLQRFIPCCDLVRFGLSGTEVVQNALRLARAYTGKNRILKFIGHYHGNADNIMGGHIDDFSHPIPYDNMKNIFSTEGRAKDSLESQLLMIPWNDPERFDETVQLYADEIAAIIMEPVCLNGGSIMPINNYLQHVREICTKNNIILIFDEIVTGIRMGLGGAQAYFNVIPDICLLGKSIGGGAVPIAAIAGKEKIMRLYETYRVVQGGTFNGYSLGLAGINTTFKLLSEMDTAAYSRMYKYIHALHDIFIENANKIGFDLVIQGPLSCSSFHCTQQELTYYSDYNEEILLKNGILRDCMAKNGLLIAHTSRMYPNICLDENDLEFFKKHIRNALEEAAMTIKRIMRVDRKIVNTMFRNVNNL